METHASLPDVDSNAVETETPVLEKTLTEHAELRDEAPHIENGGDQDDGLCASNSMGCGDYDVKTKESARNKSRTILAGFRAHVSASYREFQATFGVLGLPMVMAFILSSLTMLFLAVVQVIPTQVANWLMNTGDLDDGEFWLLSIPSRPLDAISTAMLVVFSLCYLVLALSMLFFRGYVLHWAKKHHTAHASAASAAVVHDHRSENQSEARLRPFPAATGRQSVLYELTSLHGVYHAYYNALFDLPKLAFQTATITTYLNEGFPLPLIQLYLTMLLVSWLLSFYRFQMQSGDPRFIVARLFLLFDLFFSVFAPLIVLAYAYNQFNMDREAFAIREETLSPGSYDRIARLFADPVQVDLFRFGFGHLQFTQTWYLVTKACLNLLGVYKCKKVIVLLVLEYAERKASTGTEKQDQTKPQEKVSAAQVKPRSVRSILRGALLVHGKRRHLAFGIAAFLASIVGILTYVIVAVTTSTENCRNMPECRVISYHWNAGAANDACPCIVYINRDEMPRMFEAWVNASDVTLSLAAAAKSGRLRTVQIVNRAVPELPQALQHCHSMEQLILVYSKTQSLPDWVAGFHELHYIHVESDITHYPLHTLPPNLFSHMRGLRFIRFGGASQLREFPSLARLHELTTLVLSMPHALTQLPSFDDLGALVTLVIGDATHVMRLPSLQNLKSLRSFSLFRRNAMCCNGFVSGACDLTDFQCRPRTDEPLVTCEAARLPEQDRAKLARINAFVCSANLTMDVVESEPTQLSSDVACAGAVFQQCQLGGRSGMCFNGRMQIVHCDLFGEYEAMRRRQIARGVGGACDPRVESWLGCWAPTL